MTEKATVTPIVTPEVTLVDKASKKVKKTLGNVSKDPNTRWMINTVRGVLITGITVTATQGLNNAIANGLNARLPKA